MAMVYDQNTGQQVDTSANRAATTDFFETKITSPSSQVANTTQNQVQSGNQNTTGRSYSLNTTPEILKALNDFIAQMAAGGTEEQRAVSDDRKLEIQRDREQQANFTPEAAKATAEGLSSYFMRVLSEGSMPSILRAAEGSGTSVGSTRALLEQQAAARTAEVAAKTGADLSVAFGGLSNQLAGVLEQLTRQDPNSIANQLMAAIAASKGIVQDVVSSSSTNTTQTGTTTGTTNTQKSGEVTQGNRTYDRPAANSNLLTPPRTDTFTPGSSVDYSGGNYVIAHAPEYVGSDIGGTQDDLSFYSDYAEEF